MTSEKTITVLFGTEKAKFVLNTADLSVADFGGWVRNRFGVAADSKVVFKDSDGDGILFAFDPYSIMFSLQRLFPQSPT